MNGVWRNYARITYIGFSMFKAYNVGPLFRYLYDHEFEIVLAGLGLFLNLKNNNHCISCDIGPIQVKCGLLISSIFYVMNFGHFLVMLEFKL